MHSPPSGTDKHDPATQLPALQHQSELLPSTREVPGTPLGHNWPSTGHVNPVQLVASVGFVGIVCPTSFFPGGHDVQTVLAVLLVRPVPQDVHDVVLPGREEYVLAAHLLQRASPVISAYQPDKQSKHAV